MLCAMNSDKRVGKRLLTFINNLKFILLIII